MNTKKAIAFVMLAVFVSSMALIPLGDYDTDGAVNEATGEIISKNVLPKELQSSYGENSIAVKFEVNKELGKSNYPVDFEFTINSSKSTKVTVKTLAVGNNGGKIEFSKTFSINSGETTGKFSSESGKTLGDATIGAGDKAFAVFSMEDIGSYSFEITMTGNGNAISNKVVASFEPSTGKFISKSDLPNGLSDKYVDGKSIAVEFTLGKTNIYSGDKGTVVNFKVTSNADKAATFIVNGLTVPESTISLTNYKITVDAKSSAYLLKNERTGVNIAPLAESVFNASGKAYAVLTFEEGAAIPEGSFSVCMVAVNNGDTVLSNTLSATNKNATPDVPMKVDSSIGEVEISGANGPVSITTAYDTEDSLNTVQKNAVNELANAFCFDISVSTSSGATVKVTMDLPTDLIGKKVGIYCVTPEGELDSSAATISVNGGKATVTFNHFSSYVLYEIAESGNPGSGSNPGSNPGTNPGGSGGDDTPIIVIPGNNGSGSSSTTTIVIAVAAIVVVFLAVLAFIWIKKN